MPVVYWMKLLESVLRQLIKGLGEGVKLRGSCKNWLSVVQLPLSACPIIYSEAVTEY